MKYAKYLPIVISVVVVIYYIYSLPQASRINNGVKFRVGFSSIVMLDDGTQKSKKGLCLSARTNNTLDRYYIFKNNCLNIEYKVDYTGRLIETSKIGKDIQI